MDWLYRISIICFAASYGVALAMEISRVFFKVPLRKLLILSISLAGLFAHTVYLFLQTELDLGGAGIWFGSWSGWCLAGAWILMAAYIYVFFLQPHTALGIFLLPVVLALTLVGGWFVPKSTFTEGQAKTAWNMVHGASLLLGTVTVALGFVFGIAYLLHAWRLKNKRPHSRLFRLPSLEWLQKGSERALLISVGLLALGLVSGVVVNFIQGDQHDGSAPVIAWTDPVILSSSILFAWLLLSAIFSLVYRPARQGRKVAYLVIASFLFLVMELGFVWWHGHGYSSEASLSILNRKPKVLSVSDLGSGIGRDSGEGWA